MLRALCSAVMLMSVLAVSAEAQIVSNPVVTSWPPYAGAASRVVPVAAPVAADACTPPVVTFYAPTVAPMIVSAPITRCCAPVVRYRVPTTTYYAPVTTYRVPLSPACCAPAAPVYSAPATSYYSPIASYRMPLPPSSVVYSLSPAAATPVTSYYAPVAAPVVSAPASSGRSCGCGR
jgi:hypothetical protein